MERIYPIGSVVEAHNSKLCLLGARMVEREGHLALAYVAVKYPRGFSGKESLGVVLAAEIDKVLFEGNEGRIGKKFNDGLLEVYRTMEGKTPEEAKALLDRLKSEMDRLHKESVS